MPQHRLLIALIILASSPVPYAQSGPNGVAGKLVAPGIQVLFSQSSPGSCAWRFRNADPTRTLESMRFSYTYASSPIATRMPQASASSQSGEDTLTEPLQPFEETSSRELYRAPAACATVNIRVTAAQWI